MELGSGTENKLRTRNKIKESVQEKHRIPVGIRNCVRIVTILTPLKIIHSDLAGPMESLLIGSHRYFIIFLDDYTNHVWVIFMKSKDETLRVFKTFEVMVKKCTGRSIKIFHSDCSGEFMSNEFLKFLEELGIKRETSVPRTPQQDRMAERIMCTLVGSTHAMLQHTGLSKGFWVKVIMVTVEFGWDM